MNSSLQRRSIIFIIALILMAFGVILATKANLGTSPISSVPYVTSLKLPLTIGEATIVMNIIFVIIEFVILKKAFRKKDLTQFITVIIFSISCDIFMISFYWIDITTYKYQWLLVIVSTMILAFGVSMEVAANISMMPGEFLVKIIALHTKTDFGKIKVCFDITLITISIIMSLFFFGYLNGVHEGTIFTAIATGFIVRFFNKIYDKTGFIEWMYTKELPPNYSKREHHLEQNQ
ncbi:MAG: DUF6198 family protein [Candidatus Methanomethylophilaceae archaeon]